MVKISFSTLGCPSWNLEQIVGNAKAMGFHGVDLRGAEGEHIGPDETPQERRRIRKLFESAGVEICGIMGYSHFTTDDPVRREDEIKTAIRFLDVAQDVGCPMLRVFGGMWSKQLDWKGNLQRVVTGLKRVTERAEQKGIKIILETHDDWTTSEHLMAALEAIDSPALGVCWDIGNTFFVEPMEKTCAVLGGRILHVQFKDVARKNGVEKSRLLGTGEVDLAKALALLQQIGYAGYLSFEWEKKWEPALEEPDVAFPHYVRFCNDLMK